jgi:hypothetical protein
MKSTMNWQEYKRLELIQDESRATSFVGFVNNLWQEAIARLQVTSEPRIWTVQDRQGNLHWKAFDPTTQRVVDCLTENDLRIWLEERHHQPSYLAS